jgi:predicted O-linked N-acetylglucosamine transferase (SPINDLY family)
MSDSGFSCNRNMPDPEKTFRSAVAAHRAGDLSAAERLYKRVLKAMPEQLDTLNALAHLERKRGRLQDAYAWFDRAVKLNPRSSGLLTSRGNVLLELGRPEAALQDYDKALAIDPSALMALINRGSALAKMGRSAEALASYDKALDLKPSFAPALYNRANLLFELNRSEEALQSYRYAIAAAPDYAEALNNMSECLAKLGRFEEALQSLDRALTIRPNHPPTLNNRATVLRFLGRYEEALQSLETAVAIEPKYPEALGNRAAVFSRLGRYEEAAASFRQALLLDPQHEYALGDLVYAELQFCDWGAHAASVDRLRELVRSSKRVAQPFVGAAILVSPEEQQLCAEIWVADRCPPASAPLWHGERYRHPQIRVAYLSTDFREHPVAFAIAELLERHDRTRFHTIGISCRPAPESEIGARLQRAFDTFFSMGDKSDLEVGTLLREREVDIAVDLNGHTDGARPQILALRAAPIQVIYLGYPGTMGAPYVDYILADGVVIPAEHERYYSEKVVRLPDSYLPLDSTRKFPTRRPTRREAGLPEAGFVFCGFGGSPKIRPAVFDVWMRLLGKVTGSVLWLSRASPAAIANLRSEAAKRGIDPDRLVFAPRVSMDEHLARHRLADLFLDTSPYNAHTTAADALWSGLPVLTCIGSAFAGRVAASILHAAGLPELVTNSLDEYERRALELATMPALLNNTRAKLEGNRTTQPLFDTDRLRRHVESAYLTMWDKYQHGAPPAGFAVEPIAR